MHDRKQGLFASGSITEKDAWVFADLLNESQVIIVAGGFCRVYHNLYIIYPLFYF